LVLDTSSIAELSGLLPVELMATFCATLGCTQINNPDNSINIEMNRIFFIKIGFKVLNNSVIFKGS
jgi:hypothetical protein